MSIDHLKSAILDRMENKGFTSKNPIVPKEGDKSPFLELLPEGFASEMLSIELNSGNAIAFPYNLLSKISLIDGTTLTLVFSENAVLVKGINLKELYQYLLKHQVTTLKERELHGFNIQNGKLSISKINIENREGGNQEN